MWQKRFSGLFLFLTLTLSAQANDQVQKQKGADDKLPPLVKTDGLGVYAKSAVLIEERSGKILWQKSADSKRFPASTTKILTTLLLLENTLPTDQFVAPEEIETIGEASLHLKPGEVLSARDLAYGMMLRSANDACYTVAEKLAGSQIKFAEMMNARAREIGCLNSNFVTPNGLHDPNHYTTAKDLAQIAREAMKNAEFRKLASTRKYQIQRSLNQEDRWLISRNKFLEVDQSCDGIKTGYTRPAGGCFVGSHTRNGFRVISVILASEDWKADHKAMIDWAFQKYERRMILPSNKGVLTATFPKSAQAVPVMTKNSIYYADRKGARPIDLTPQIEYKEDLTLPIPRGKLIGFVTYADEKGWKTREPIYNMEEITPGGMISGGKGTFFPTVFIMMGLGYGWYYIHKKQKNLYKRANFRKQNQ